MINEDKDKSMLTIHYQFVCVSVWKMREWLDDRTRASEFCQRWRACFWWRTHTHTQYVEIPEILNSRQFRMPRHHVAQCVDEREREIERERRDRLPSPCKDWMSDACFFLWWRLTHSGGGIGCVGSFSLRVFMLIRRGKSPHTHALNSLKEEILNSRKLSSFQFTSELALVKYRAKKNFVVGR